MEDYDVDVFKDVLFGRKGRVFLYVDIEEKNNLKLNVISNHLTVLGLEDSSSITFDKLFSYIDSDNKYSEIAGKDDYLTYIKTEMIAFHKEINISFPIKIDNTRRWVHFNGFPIEKNPRIYVFLAHDISNLMSSEEALYEKTHKDSLTGLFNRYTFDYHYGKRYQLDNLHILYLDLDDFKSVNDQFGHKVGNAMLQSFADVLKTFHKGYNYFYRLGGDEFVGLIFEEKNEVVKIANKILNETRKITFPNNDLSLTVSMGVIKASKKDDPVLKADNLLYQAKKQGKNQYIYDEE